MQTHLPITGEPLGCLYLVDDDSAHSESSEERRVQKRKLKAEIQCREKNVWTSREEMGVRRNSEIGIDVYTLL